jgi:hypothetical protein
MKPIDSSHLEMTLYIQLRVLRGPTKTHLQHLGTDQACRTAARLIMERCLSRFAIFAPDEVYRRYRPDEFGSLNTGSEWLAGRFGETEPWSAPPADPEPGRCRVCGVNDIDGLGEELARRMWDTLVPATPFEKAGEHRVSFLLIAHHAINWLGRTHVGEGFSEVGDAGRIG